MNASTSPSALNPHPVLLPVNVTRHPRSPSATSCKTERENLSFSLAYAPEKREIGCQISRDARSSTLADLAISLNRRGVPLRYQRDGELISISREDRASCAQMLQVRETFARSALCTVKNADACGIIRFNCLLCIVERAFRAFRYAGHTGERVGQRFAGEISLSQKVHRRFAAIVPLLLFVGRSPFFAIRREACACRAREFFAFYRFIIWRRALSHSTPEFGGPTLSTKSNHAVLLECRNLFSVPLTYGSFRAGLPLNAFFFSQSLCSKLCF